MVSKAELPTEALSLTRLDEEIHGARPCKKVPNQAQTPPSPRGVPEGSPRPNCRPKPHYSFLSMRMSLKFGPTVASQSKSNPSISMRVLGRPREEKQPCPQESLRRFHEEEETIPLTTVSTTAVTPARGGGHFSSCMCHMFSRISKWEGRAQREQNQCVTSSPQNDPPV